jgi:hypothetical protein
MSAVNEFCLGGTMVVSARSNFFTADTASKAGLNLSFRHDGTVLKCGTNTRGTANLVIVNCGFLHCRIYTVCRQTSCQYVKGLTPGHHRPIPAQDVQGLNSSSSQTSKEKLSP